MKTGDLKSTERGSGARDNGGKVEFSLLPLHVLAGPARILMSGRVKYAAHNWAKGMNWSTAVDCIMRHLFKWFYLGEEIDPESGEHHLAHVCCNVLFLLHYIETHKSGDDRPPAELTRFNESMGDFSKLFDLEAYLDRNPAIRARVESKE